MSCRVAVLALDGSLSSAVVGVSDVFEAANAIAAAGSRKDPPLYRVRTVTPHGRSVRLSNGLRLEVDGNLGSVRSPHVVVVVGLGIRDANVDAAIDEVRARYPAALAWLGRQYRRGAIVAGSCTGTFILAETGVLDERVATTTWWLAEAFRNRYPRVRLDLDAMIATDDRIVTAGAAMAYLDLCLHLIARQDPKLASLVAKYLVIDNHRRSQGSYAVAHQLRVDDAVVQRAVAWVARRLTRPTRVHDVARAVGVSPRTLARRFKDATGTTITAYVQRQRIERAKGLLETTRLSVDDVVHRVGYSDTASFIRLFKRHTAASPQAYRRRFAAPD